MLKIYNLKEKEEYIKEVANLTEKEWGTYKDKKEFDYKVEKKIKKIINSFDNEYYCKLILLDNDSLAGFISIFPSDGEERNDLTPWYSTMYVKDAYRGKGYSKILNDAIIKEAKKRGFEKIYLKSSLENYYEKFGAIYIENLNDGEKLYYIDLK